MNVDYAAAYPALYREHWWWRSRERILLRRIASLVAGRSAPRILDVGCGAGLFFDALSAFGEVDGIESDIEAVAGAGRWRHRIQTTPLSAEGRSYDLVLLLDVLEHLEDARGLLLTVARRLAEGGYVLATVPAFQCLWTSHDELNHHRRRYTAESLRREFESAGLRGVETRYLFQSLVLPKLCTRVVELVAPRPPRVPAIPPLFVNRALESWLYVENATLGWLPFGGSVMAVAARSVELPSRPAPSFDAIA